MTKSTKPQAPAAAKPGNVRIAVPLSATLELIAAEVASALQETASLSESLGELTRCAGVEIKKHPDMLDPFVDACKQMCAAVGLTEGSVKTYLSNIRGVLRAMVEGYKPKADQTLRSMYDAAPKGTGRQKAPAAKTGARHDTDKPIDHDAETRTEAAKVATPMERQRAAIVELFGHCDDEMMGALTWASQHEARFMALIKSQIAFDAKPVGKVSALKQAA